MELSEEDLKKIEHCLGRKPRGAKEILLWNQSLGLPKVIRVSSFVDEKPFPTIYWLTCPVLKKRIDSLEASGLIKDLEQELKSDPELLESHRLDNLEYIKRRKQAIIQDKLSNTIPKTMLDSLERKGIGGIDDFSRVRCLHMNYAFHLVRPTTIGKILDLRYKLYE